MSVVFVWGPEMKRGICFVLLIWCASARGALPTVGYVSEYYFRNCSNVNLSVPGAGISNLVSEKYILNIVAMLNDGVTTYGTDAATDYVASVDFVTATLPLLGDSQICCLGGYYENSNNVCQSCGEWMTDSTDMCFDSGQYYKNGKCTPCEDGYICAAGTSARVECGSGYWCVNNRRTRCEYGVGQCPMRTHSSQPSSIGCNAHVIATTVADKCVGAGVYFNGSECVTCPAGYICPSGTSKRINCGPGFWCAGNVRTECADGVRQCPYSNHGALPNTLGCNQTWNFIK